MSTRSDWPLRVEGPFAFNPPPYTDNQSLSKTLLTVRQWGCIVPAMKTQTPKTPGKLSPAARAFFVEWGRIGGRSTPTPLKSEAAKRAWVTKRRKARLNLVKREQPEFPGIGGRV